MFRLDRKMHRYFIEPISEMKHLKTSLIKRFGNFTQILSTIRKRATRNVFNMISNDCRGTTGRNMRCIMQEYGKLLYQPVPFTEKWKIEFAKELINIRDFKTVSVNLSKEDVKGTLNHICTS